jgi:MATE family multidrug resistance protein
MSTTLLSESELKKTYWNTVFHSVMLFAGQMSMQIVDLIFCSRLGADASATAGTATSLFAWFMVVGNGVVFSLEYLIPHALGEKNESKAHSLYYSGWMVSILVSLFSTCALILLAFRVDWFGINPQIAGDVTRFTSVLALSYLPLFMSPTLRVELQSRGHPHVSSYAFILGNLLNVFLNWALIHGHAGLPALGLIGSAWSNVISRFFIMAILWITAWIARSKIQIPIHWRQVRYREFVPQIVKLGTPASLHMLFEMGAFILVSTLAAQFTTDQAAAHSIILNIATFVFMFPLGFSSAAALTLSRLNGEKRHQLAIQYGWSTIKLGWVYALISSTFLIVFQKQLFALYSHDARIFEIGSQILLIAAFFQLGDATQVIVSGCLRGFGKTGIQAVVNGIGHWLIGLPIGLYFSYRLQWQVRGLWIGLSTGLIVVAIVLLYFWKKTTHTAETLKASESIEATL